MAFFPLMLAVPKLMKFANTIFEEHLIPLRRLRRHTAEKEIHHKVTLRIDEADVNIHMALTKSDIDELESSNGWRVIERGAHVHNLHRANHISAKRKQSRRKEQS